MQSIVWRDGSQADHVLRIYRDNERRIVKVEEQCRLLGRLVFADVTNEYTDDVLRAIGVAADDRERKLQAVACTEPASAPTHGNLPGAFGAEREP